MEPDNSHKESGGLVQIVKDNIGYHLASSTAINVVATPVFAAFETGVSGMSDDVSINARVIGAGLVYLGMGYVLSKTRDSSRKLFHIYETSKERIQALHDSLHLTAFNLVSGPLLYLGAGARDPKEIAIGTGIGCAFGLVAGPVMGYTIDLYQDLIGIKESKRVPAVIRRQPGKIKKTLFALITAAALAVTAGIYAMTSDKKVDDARPAAQSSQVIDMTPATDNEYYASLEYITDK